MVISALTSPDVVQRTLEVPSVHAFVPKSASANHVRLAMDAALIAFRRLLEARVQAERNAATASPQPAVTA